MGEVLPIRDDSVAEQKAELIIKALQTSRAAQAIDERDDDLDVASFTAWYDATIPYVKEHEGLLGAMVIELMRRRGELILHEEERRGGDMKSEEAIKVEQRSTLISPAEKDRRKEARVIASQPEAVQSFIQRELKAGRKPSVRGAVGVARHARLMAAPSRRINQTAASQAKVAASEEQIFAAIDKVADGTRRTEDQVATITGYKIPSFLARIRLIPWLRIDRTHQGLLFQIDAELRAICDGRRPRASLSYQSIDHFLHHLRTEIARKRKENRDEREKTRWDSRLILTRIQSDILDWIEQQLDRVPTR